MAIDRVLIAAGLLYSPGYSVPHFSRSNKEASRFRKIRSAPSFAPHTGDSAFEKARFASKMKTFLQQHSKRKNLAHWIGAVCSSQIVSSSVIGRINRRAI